MAKFDPAKFNTDPKHQEERDFLDSIVESSAQRIAEKLKAKKKPGEPEPVNPFDAIFGSLMKGGEE